MPNNTEPILNREQAIKDISTALKATISETSKIRNEMSKLHHISSQKMHNVERRKGLVATLLTYIGTF